MTTVVTTNLKLANIDDFISSINSEVYYLFTSWSLPFSDDLNPPTISDTVNDTYIDPYKYMINAKLLSNTNVTPMVKRHDWVYNTVYEKYSHDNSTLMLSNFFVIVDEGAYYSVFKCLDNNNGSASTDAPSITGTSPSDDIYFTSDGYQWKYMYSITQSEYDNFATTEYIPVFANTQVSGNAVSGSIHLLFILFTFGFIII